MTKAKEEKEGEGKVKDEKEGRRRKEGRKKVKDEKEGRKEVEGREGRKDVKDEKERPLFRTAKETSCKCRLSGYAFSAEERLASMTC